MITAPLQVGLVAAKLVMDSKEGEELSKEESEKLRQLLNKIRTQKEEKIEYTQYVKYRRYYYIYGVVMCVWMVSVINSKVNIIDCIMLCSRTRCDQVNLIYNGNSSLMGFSLMMLGYICPNLTFFDIINWSYTVWGLSAQNILIISSFLTHYIGVGLTFETFKIFGFIQFDDCDFIYYNGIFHYIIWLSSIIRFICLVVAIKFLINCWKERPKLKNKIKVDDNWDYSKEEMLDDMSLKRTGKNVLIKYTRDETISIVPNKITKFFTGSETVKKYLIEIDPRFGLDSFAITPKILREFLLNWKSITNKTYSITHLESNRDKYHVKITVNFDEIV